MQISHHQTLIDDQSSAALRLRIARADYRRALVGGDLTAAIKAHQAVMEAEVLLNVFRSIVEGNVDG